MKPSLFGSSPEAVCVAPEVFHLDPPESDPRKMKYYIVKNRQMTAVTQPLRQ